MQFDFAILAFAKQTRPASSAYMTTAMVSRAVRDTPVGRRESMMSDASFRPGCYRFNEDSYSYQRRAALRYQSSARAHFIKRFLLEYSMRFSPRKPTSPAPTSRSYRILWAERYHKSTVPDKPAA